MSEISEGVRIANAVREIVELHEPANGQFGPQECPVCCDPDERGIPKPVRAPCNTVRVLASIWADHADYDDAWGPDAA